MNHDLNKKIIQKWAGNMTKDKQIITLFEKVRDIPYGNIGSRDPYDVFNHNTGTCSGKHELLKSLYHSLGIQTQDYIAIHRFKNLPIQFPQNLKELLERSDITDPHNFFKMKVDEKWVTIDVTWDAPLKKWGFPVNEHWDGKTDTKICVVPLAIIKTDDPMGYKKQELSKLPPKIQEDRKLFLSELTKWVTTLRKS